jgi:hypothetical protein
MKGSDSLAFGPFKSLPDTMLVEIRLPRGNPV